jgi:ATP-binding cassette subfamily B protein
MKRQVIDHLLRTYGRAKSIWVGTAFTAASHIVSKIFVPMALATWVAEIAVSKVPSLAELPTIVLLYLGALLFGAVGDYVFVKRSDELYEKLVGRFYDLVIQQDAGFFRAEKAGLLSAMFRNLLDGTINLFRLLRTEIIPLLVATVGAVVVLAKYDWRAAAVFTFAAVLRGYLSWRAIRRLKSLRRDAIEVYNQLSGSMGDQMALLPIVRASGNREASREQITNLASEEGRLFWVRHLASARYDFLANVLVAVGLVAVLVVVDYSNHGPVERIEFAVLSLIFVVQGMQAAHGVGELQQRWSERWEHVVTSLQKLPRGVTAPYDDGKYSPVPTRGDIEFRDVVFSYGGHGSNGVFQAADFKINNGEHVAIVGDNGAGKSTLISLLMRFDRAQGGQVLLSGKPVEDWEEKAFYQSLAYVPQEPKLFNKSVIDNIKFYEPNASKQRMDRVWSILRIPELEAALAEGLETSVGEMGSQLSSGQKQIVAIARALLRDAKVYIFDEATSALHVSRARETAQAIRDFLSDRTVVFVTHSNEIAKIFPVTLNVAEGQIERES